MPFPSARRASLLAVAVLVLGGCSQGGTASPPEPSPTPIANLNTDVMRVPRIDFCKLVPDDAVKDALGAKPSTAAAYGNGDTEPASGVRDQVLHEIGCVWTAADGTTARAWVFARPVDTRVAQTVVRATGRQQGCKAIPGPAFGTPTVTQQCTLPGNVSRVRHAGLFGQTWLTCEVAGTGGSQGTETAAAGGNTADAVARRTDAWCVDVAESLNTAR